jgi:hypothetical protein
LFQIFNKCNKNIYNYDNTNNYSTNNLKKNDVIYKKHNIEEDDDGFIKVERKIKLNNFDNKK